MNTITIELVRTGTAYSHSLSGDSDYIALCGTYPQVTFSVDCDQHVFDDQIDQLRYDTAEDKRLAAIKFLQDLLTGVLDKIEALQKEANKNDDWLHVRLLTTPKELAQLPFELALMPKGFKGEHSKAFLLNPDKPATLTREVRQVNANAYQWPSRPRILFAWASPEMAVPSQDHYDALEQLLQPLAGPMADNIEPVPDLRPLITGLRSASKKSLREAIAAAIAEDRPYTHIHILAHGIRIPHRSGDEYKLMLHDDDDPKKANNISGSELANAIIETAKDFLKYPAVISLMTCDSGNEGSTILPSGSLAHELHEAGIPCVFASQFPLTMEGSIKLVKCLYEKLLIDVDDPRKALYYTRMALDNGKFHDWASLVAHVRFPENINHQLEGTKLQGIFTAMKTANHWTDHVFKNRAAIKPERIKRVYDDVKVRLDKAIAGLSDYLKDGNSVLSDPDLKAEHLGILGSAYKRRAQHEFHMIELDPLQEKDLKALSSESARLAMGFYRKGFDANPVSHWNAMQYLSLKAVAEGSLQTDTQIWNVIQYMAERDEQFAPRQTDKAWAWGSLAELYMLRPLTVSPDAFQTETASSIIKAKEYVSKIRACGEAGVRDSTARQLERYISWFPQIFSSTCRKDLAVMATALRDELLKE